MPSSPQGENPKLGGRFRRDFFARSCLRVAPDLLGAYLVRIAPGAPPRIGRIVEVEAYLGDGSDPAAHSHRGPTPRSRVMFGPPGRLYVYRSYGIHVCANVVCEPEGSGAAVLLRAVEPVAGLPAMRAERGLAAGALDRQLASGPGKLCQAFGIALEHYGASLLDGALCLRRPARGDPRPAIARGPRIGISQARGLPYRFHVPGNPHVSR